MGSVRGGGGGTCGGGWLDDDRALSLPSCSLPPSRASSPASSSKGRRKGVLEGGGRVC